MVVGPVSLGEASKPQISREDRGQSLPLLSLIVSLFITSLIIALAGPSNGRNFNAAFIS